jgi:Family of unknown function (DUF5678)
MGKCKMMKEEEVLKKFSGEWILLFNDKIVDHSANIEDILETCEKKYPEDKYPNDEIKISKVLDRTLKEF